MKKMLIIIVLVGLTLIMFNTGFAAQRMVMFELCTSTTCPPCVAANAALNNLMIVYEDDMAVIRYHAWWPPPGNDPFYLINVAENTTRVNYYDPGYVPHGYIDGIIDGESNHPAWSGYIQNRLGVASPLTLDLTVPYTGRITAMITAEEELAPDNILVHFVITESNIAYTGTNGDPIHHQVMRDMIPDGNGHQLIIAQGETIEMPVDYTIDETWERDNLEMVVFVQNNSTKEVYQAAKITIGFEISLVEHMIFETTGDGDGRLENGESGIVVVTLENSTFPPGFSNVIGQLSTDDPSIDVVQSVVDFGDLAMSESTNNIAIPFEFNVIGDYDPHLTTFELMLTSDELQSLATFDMIVGRPLLLIDDDDGGDLESYYTVVFDEQEQFYELRTSAEAITDAYLTDYPTAIWFTGDAGNGLTESEIAGLSAYLDAGGNLLLSGQDIAQLLPSGSTFLADYFGLEFLDSAGQAVFFVEGMAGDEYFDDVRIVLVGGDGAGNQTSVDYLQLSGDSQADPIFEFTDASGLELGLAGVRYTDSESGYKAVFTSFGLEAIHPAENYNSRREVLETIFQFFAGPNAIEDEIGVKTFATCLEQNKPNPFNPSTTIGFSIANGGLVSLKVFNTAGRLVKTLIDGELAPDSYQVTWDGTDNHNVSVASGVYLYQFQSAELNETKRMVLIK
ncbi:MAG: Omp28-related outer membrane protein [Planctomycetes bacterium]|nr:Omp28-related outer membrane protein [Planctomycetota bacterium]